MGRVYRRWMIADPVAAQASLNQLPPEKQAAVLEAMRNPRDIDIALVGRPAD